MFEYVLTNTQYYQDIADAIRQRKTEVDKRLATIAVTTPPTKTTYTEGETLSLSGMVITATYVDNTTAIVTGWTASPANGSTLSGTGSKIITISYTANGITRVTTTSVTVESAEIYVNGVKIVPWSTGSDADIAAMVTGAEQGKIDLTDYWNVGDERTIHLDAMAATGVGESHAAQDVTMVLVDKNNQNYTYVTTPSSGRTYPFFIVQQKNALGDGALGEGGYMNNENTNVGSWNGCARRTWCNNVYKAAIPSSIRNIFHQVKVKTAETYNGTTIQQSNDYFFFPAAAEVYKGDSIYGTGTNAGLRTAYSNLTEFNTLSIWEYYTISGNRGKKDGNNGSQNYWWWERSPEYNNTTGFCYTNSNAVASSGFAYAPNLIAPAGCI